MGWRGWLGGRGGGCGGGGWASGSDGGKTPPANWIRFAQADLRNLLLGDLGLRGGTGCDGSVGGIAGVALVADRGGNRRDADFSVALVEIDVVMAGRWRRAFSVHCFPPGPVVAPRPSCGLMPAR